MAPSTNRNKNCLAILKRQSPPKKLKTESKSTHKRRQNSCSNCSSLEPDSERDKQKKDKRHIFAPTAGARSSISPPQTFDDDTEHRDHEKSF